MRSFSVTLDRKNKNISILIYYRYKKVLNLTSQQRSTFFIYIISENKKIKLILINFQFSIIELILRGHPCFIIKFRNINHCISLINFQELIWKFILQTLNESRYSKMLLWSCMFANSLLQTKFCGIL